jgi:hypothetical protein
VVVVLLVEPVTPEVPLPLVLPLVPLPLMLPLPVELGLDPLEPDEPVPVAPIELVLPVVPLLPVVVSLLPLLPVVVLGLVLLEPVVDGVVVLLDELVPAAPVLSRLLHALRERAATTARTAAVTWVRDIFIRKLLGWFVRSANRKGSRDCPVLTLGRRRMRRVGTGRIRV